MKKLLCLLGLSALLILSSCNFGSGASVNDQKAFAGFWELSRIEGAAPRETAEIDNLRALGMNVTLQLKEDGKGTLDLFGKIDSGSWKASSSTKATIVLSTGEKVEMTLSDGVLSMKQGQDLLEFRPMDNDSVEAMEAKAASGAKNETADISPIEIANDDFATIKIAQLKTDLVNDIGFVATITNKTDEPIRVTATEGSFSLDGKMATVSGGTIIQPGKYADAFFWFDKQEVGDISLNDLKNVEGEITIYNKEDAILNNYIVKF